MDKLSSYLISAGGNMRDKSDSNSEPFIELNFRYPKFRELVELREFCKAVDDCKHLSLMKSIWLQEVRRLEDISAAMRVGQGRSRNDQKEPLKPEDLQAKGEGEVDNV